MIKLFGVPMSRAMRSLWALEEIGVPYELVSTDFVTGAHKPEYLKINPNGRISALQDGDVTLFESLAINLYLARKHGSALWPKTVADEGRGAVRPRCGPRPAKEDSGVREALAALLGLGRVSSDRGRCRRGRELESHEARGLQQLAMLRPEAFELLLDQAS